MSSSNKSRDVLRWIEDDAAPVRPPIDEFPTIGQGQGKSRIMKKISENLFVPIGLLATTACLTLGLLNLKRGDSKKQQFYMRGRVLFQGLTLAAMVATIMSAKKSLSK